MSLVAHKEGHFSLLCLFGVVFGPVESVLASSESFHVLQYRTECKWEKRERAEDFGSGYFFPIYFRKLEIFSLKKTTERMLLQLFCRKKVLIWNHLSNFLKGVSKETQIFLIHFPVSSFVLRINLYSNSQNPFLQANVFQ